MKVQILFIVTLLATVEVAPPPVVIGPDSVTVSAGTPGSLTLVDTVGPTGPAIRCTWHELVFAPDGRATSRPAAPVTGQAFVLWCLHPDDTVVDGYPILVVYDPTDPIPGDAVSSEEAARFAVRSIDFGPPEVRLSPVDAQIVGVPTWLAVGGQLDHPPATAQAGAVWATVRPVFRDVTWQLGDGATIVCTDDATTVWVEGGDPAQSSRCTHVYERSAEGGVHPVSATVTWAIWWTNDRRPGIWELFDTLSLTTTALVEVRQLQAVIR